MVLTRSQYEHVSKEELIQELSDINSSFVNDINAKLTDLSKMFNEFTSKYRRFIYSYSNEKAHLQKQPFIGVLIKRCFGNVQLINRIPPISKCDFNSNFIEITLRHGCSPVNLLHISRTPFPKNTSGGLLLHLLTRIIQSERNDVTNSEKRDN